MTLPSLVLVLLGLTGLAGCESTRPEGPGSYVVTLDWEEGADPAGAALLFVWAPGITAMEPLDGVLLWTSTIPADEGWTRVVVIHPEDVPHLRFTLEVEDVGAGQPAAVIREIASQANANVLSPGGGFPGYRLRVVPSR
jgi:hypothetical protein